MLNSDDVQLDGSTHAAHFNSAFQSEFRLVNVALTSQLATVPLPSPASGFTYHFDAATGTFVRSTRSFGPILAERAETIGRGKIAFGYTYQFFSYDQLDGVSLANIPGGLHPRQLRGRRRPHRRRRHQQHHRGDGHPAHRRPHLRVVGSRRRLARGAGGADRLSLLSNATIHRIGTGSDLGIHYFRDPDAIGGYGSTRQYFAEGSAGGVGDLVARVKATMMREGSRALAAGLDVRMPTGDEQNLLGSGAIGVRPFVAFSASIGAFAPHANAAYQWNGESLIGGSVREGIKADLPDQFVYALGADVLVAPRLSVVLDLFGQRVVSSPRLTAISSTRSGVAGTVTLDDIRFVNESYWTSAGGFGLKANVAPQMLLTFNLRFAISDGGLTDRLSPLLGMEWAF